MIALQMSPKIKSLYRLGRRRPQNYKGLYGYLRLVQGSHLTNVPLKTPKLSWQSFLLVTFQLKCLDFNINNIKKSCPSPLTFLSHLT